MANKDYKTSVEIDKLVKVNNVKITNPNDFENVYEKLNEDKYYSRTAEKRRLWHKKFSIQMFKNFEEANNLFQRMILSFYRNIDPNVNIEDLKKSGYVPSVKDGNINSVEYVDEKGFFRNVYIHKDVIYTDTFKLTKTKKGGYTLTVYKFIKVPFPRELMSQHTHLSNWTLKKDWKIYKKQIVKGIFG